MSKERTAEWRRDNYRRLVADIDKQEADTFLEILKNDRLAFQTWIKQQIKTYVSESKNKNIG